MQSLIKWGAGVILTIILAPLMIWAGSSIVNHGEKLARLEEKEKTTKEHYLDLKKDIREIKVYLMGIQ